MWTLINPWYVPALKGIFVYLLLFIIIRMIGKKKLGELQALDLVLILVMSGSLNNVTFQKDHPFQEAIISIASMGGLHLLINTLKFKFKWLEKIVYGEPVVLILNGKIHKQVLKKQKISDSELYGALRDHEVMKPEDVKCAILEVDGKISIIKYIH